MSTTSQVIFNIDSKLKARAMKKAKSQGLPLSSILNSVVRSFVDGEVSVGLKEDFNAKTRRQILKADRDFKAGKNISPLFTSIAQMRRWVDNS